MLEAFTRRLTTMLGAVRKDRGGVTAVEYGVIAALIIVLCITALQLVGNNLNTSFSTLGSSLPR